MTCSPCQDMTLRISACQTHRLDPEPAARSNNGGACLHGETGMTRGLDDRAFHLVADVGNESDEYTRVGEVERRAIGLIAGSNHDRPRFQEQRHSG